MAGAALTQIGTIPVSSRPPGRCATRINRIIRDRTPGGGRNPGTGAHRGVKLLSRGLTRAEAGLHSSYAEGDTVIFNRRYKRLGVEKGDERNRVRNRPEASGR